MVIREIWSEEEYFADDGISGEAWDLVLPPDWEEPYKWAVDAEGVPVVSL